MPYALPPLTAHILPPHTAPPDCFSLPLAQYGDDAEYLEDEEEYDEEGDEGEEGDEWAISAQREQHMRSALMIQKAACLDMIGEQAYSQL